MLYIRCPADTAEVMSTTRYAHISLQSPSFYKVNPISANIGNLIMSISNELEQTSQTIINIHRDIFGESPTPMKLQKLCYYAQGYALAESSQLFPDEFQAWQHGPVIYDLYTKYKDYQWRQITEEIPDKPHPRQEYLIDIVAAYGRYDGAALSTMTHRELPWKETRGDLDESDGCNKTITKEIMITFFKSKIK